VFITANRQHHPAPRSPDQLRDECCGTVIEQVHVIHAEDESAVTTDLD
jgi:hypothetical protein